MWRRRLRALSVSAVVAASALGCNASQPTQFEQVAQAADAGIASARATLELVHAGRLTIPYGAAAFVEYRSLLHGASQQVRSASGSPANVDAIARAVRDAENVVESPCLEDTCDWRGQLRVFERARSILAPAVGS